ncbi:T9SS type A sorting domain-containing protein [Dyadobacter psychrotolerans]|uniref:T9SS type A sorting domain-containing protein n=1 Tax=Dyadobacter psychrotolerans TaxID=2541721 RepID=A0A4R5DRL4_9BACT|nr:T9SS type A sorting domain-containing protein [Dyadobacter psychrotolerans]TDE13715.1 T9SS type A sorting domain-containing protein [Dyadobacter psychrotolerans]
MKHIFAQSILMPVILISGLALSEPTFAQSSEKSKKTTIRVRVSEDDKGKTKDVEKEYKVNNMNDQERKQFVDKVLDSLGVDSKSGKVVSVTMDDGEGDTRVITRKRRNVVIDRRDDREPLAFHWDGNNEFSFDTEKLQSQMRNFEREFRPKAKVFMRDMENFGDQLGSVWTREGMKAASVRELSVYSNNPDNGVLNLRFHAQQKGDLNITVTDTKGKEVGKKEIKDFSGDFVGQIDLKKNTKGTVFVTVVQNEDGAVKRVVIP